MVQVAVVHCFHCQADKSVSGILLVEDRRGAGPTGIDGCSSLIVAESGQNDWWDRRPAGLMILLLEDRRDAGPTGNDYVFSVTFADLDVVGGTGVPPVLSFC